MKESRTILKHTQGEIRGHVQCEVCKEITEISSSTYYAVYKIWGETTVLGMEGFACKKCFDRSREKAEEKPK